MLFNLFLAPSFLILFLLNPLKNFQKEFVDISINSKKESMEVANTKYKQAVGLMFRDLDKTGGMVFTYTTETNPSYYNKNVRFPIRIYFLDKDSKIKSTYIMQKNSFKIVSAKARINYVVEVPLKDDLSNDPGESAQIKISE